MPELKVKSPAFGHNEMIPEKYTCHGKDVNPPLVLEDVPKEAKSLAIIVDDPDAPMGTWVHWVVWNIDPKNTTIEEDSAPGIVGINDFDRNSWGGPCPPSGTHHYFFKVYALDTMLNIEKSSEKEDLEWEMEGHVLAKGQLIGLYKKP